MGINTPSQKANALFDFAPTHAAQAARIVQTLQEAGFTAYFAGGCVRDALLGRAPKDFDVATDATPDKVREVFGKRKTLAFGASFGVIGVLGDADTPTEVATFRSDGEYSDGRRPDSVRFGTAEHDAQRRDFTINGMFYDPVASRVIDFVGGQADLQNRTLRAIGDAEKRFDEDKLRMLRVVRFASALDFSIDAATLVATRKHAAEVTVVSGERIGAEMRRMFTSVNASKAIRLLVQTELLPPIWPVMSQAIRSGVVCLDVASQLVDCVKPASFCVAVASLLSKSGAAPKHAVDQLVESWKLSSDEQRGISESIKHFFTLSIADQIPWSTVQPILASRDGLSILATARSIASLPNQTLCGVEYCEERMTWDRERLDPPPLINGDTLRQLGFAPGPKFREVIQTVRDMQLDGVMNSVDQAVTYATAQFASGV